MYRKSNVKKNWIQKPIKCVVDIEHFNLLNVVSRNWQSNWLDEVERKLGLIIKFGSEEWKWEKF